MSALSAKQVKELIRKTQERYEQIQHENWDAERSRYRMPDTAMWQLAAWEVVPEQHVEWREFVRVLAQGESYYGGQYDG
jgi:hypothetical protein